MKFSSGRTVTIAGSLLAVVSIAAIAQAATDTIYRYTTPKVGVFQISALAMTPNTDNVAYVADLADGSLQLTSNLGCFNTGVHLPQGATITALTAYFASGPDIVAPTFFLVRHTFSDGNLLTIGSSIVGDNTGDRKPFQAAIAAGMEPVNNNKHNYSFAVCLATTDNIFYGARIGYTYTNAGD